MPAVPKVSAAAIVDAGRQLLETGGPNAVTMQAVADRVGVRAPSLYKHVRDRDALLAAVRDDALREFTDLLHRAGTDERADPRKRLVSLARAVRAFANDRPHTFALAFQETPVAPASRALLERAVAPLYAATAEVVGEPDALQASRLLTAWVKGFIGMERTGAFRLGEDTDASFEWGLERLVSSLT